MTIFSTIFAILFSFIISGFGIFDGSNLCSEETKIMSSSTISSHQVLWWARNCGATTDFYTKIIAKDTYTQNEIMLVEGEGYPQLSVEWSTTSAKVTVFTMSELYEYQPSATLNNFEILTEVKKTIISR